MTTKINIKNHTKDCSSDFYNTTENNQNSVFISGFPRNSEAKEIESFVDNLHKESYTCKKDEKGTFKGYLILHFSSYNKANKFLKKPIFYKEKKLSVKICESAKDHLKENLINALMPKKLFVYKINKKIKREDLQKFFQKFGDVQECI